MCERGAHLPQHLPTSSKENLCFHTFTNMCEGKRLVVSKPASKPASQQASKQPASQPVSQQASQPARQLASQPASQPAKPAHTHTHTNALLGPGNPPWTAPTEVFGPDLRPSLRWAGALHVQSPYECVSMQHHIRESVAQKQKELYGGSSSKRICLTGLQ